MKGKLFLNNWYHKNSELGNEKSEANERGEQNTQNIQYYEFIVSGK